MGVIGFRFRKRLPVSAHVLNESGDRLASTGVHFSANFTVVLVSCAGVGLAQGFGHPAVIALLGEVVQSQWRPMLFCGISSWYG